MFTFSLRLQFFTCNSAAGSLLFKESFEINYHKNYHFLPLILATRKKKQKKFEPFLNILFQTDYPCRQL